MRVAGFALKRHAIRCVQRYTCTGLGSVRCRTRRDRSPLQTFLSNPFRRESRSLPAQCQPLTPASAVPAEFPTYVVAADRGRKNTTAPTMSARAVFNRFQHQRREIA